MVAVLGTLFRYHNLAIRVTVTLRLTVAVNVSWLQISHAGQPNKSLPLAETHVGLYAKFSLLLFRLNQERNLSANFSRTALPQIELKSFYLFSRCFLRTDRQTLRRQCVHSYNFKSLTRLKNTKNLFKHIRKLFFGDRVFFIVN